MYHKYMFFSHHLSKKKKKVLAWLKCCKLRANKIGFDLEDPVCLFVFASLTSFQACVRNISRALAQVKLPSVVMRFKAFLFFIFWVLFSK